MNFEGKVALVTGGSKGIGAAVARALAGTGANVVICSRNAEEVERVAKEIDSEATGTVTGIACDMRSFDQVQKLVAETVARHGRLDILINNAGVGGFSPIDQITPESWHQIIETNLNGAFYASHEVIPHMRERGEGWIINIGSLAGKNPMPGGTAYNASKFGLLGFSEAMMLDVRHYGIRVSCIMPGSVETDFSGVTGKGPAAWKLQGEDIAQMVLDLLSFHSRALPSRVEMRPSQPPKK